MQARIENLWAHDTAPWLFKGSALVKCSSLIVVVTFLVLYYRRPDQLFTPYIWVEDGTVSLPQYLRHGWLYLFEPVAGYLILPSKAIQLVSLWASARHYPELAFFGTITFNATVLCAVALARVILKYPLLCALLTLFVPIDSEVFGTSHYAFWWGSLLLLPPLLWKPEDDTFPWSRLLMVFVGALSSPLVIALMPIQFIRSFVYRNRNEWLVFALVATCASVQLYFLKATGTHGADLPDYISPPQIVSKFFGYFVYWTPASSQGSFALGVLSLGCIISAALAGRRNYNGGTLPSQSPC